MLSAGIRCHPPTPRGPEIHLTQVESAAMVEAADPTTSSEPPNSGERADEVRDRLRAVMDPELGDTIVDLGMVRDIAIDGAEVTVGVALTIAACPLRNQIEKD